MCTEIYRSDLNLGGLMLYRGKLIAAEYEERTISDNGYYFVSPDLNLIKINPSDGSSVYAAESVYSRWSLCDENFFGFICAGRFYYDFGDFSLFADISG